MPGLNDPDAAPDPDTLVMSVHFAGVTFSPTISKFTIEELKSTGDLRLLRNQALKRQIADYYNQVGLQVEQWIAWGEEGITETYFRELAFVIDPDRILTRIRTRPDFEGYLRDSMYRAHLSARLLDGIVLSAEELDAAIAKELEVLRR